MFYFVQDDTGTNEIDLMGGKFVWDSNLYVDIQPDQGIRRTTAYEYFVVGANTIYIKKIGSYERNQYLGIESTDTDMLKLNASGDTLLV